MVLVNYHLAIREKRKNENNHKSFEVLILTTETEDRDTIELYRMLFERCWEDGKDFDPLNMFDGQ